MNRDDLIKNLKDRQSDQWDVIVIGGGATGLGVALDAVTRGYKTLLLEQSDFTTRNLLYRLIHCGMFSFIPSD
jgi:glycerol-3-phosphate dehydrogenase